MRVSNFVFFCYRNYKRKTERSPITPEVFQRAKQMLQNGLSQRRVASELGFSEGALRKRLKLDCGVEQLGRFKPVFSAGEDLELAEHAKKLEKLFYGLTLKSLRKLAYQYAEANGIENSFSKEKQMAGKDWAYSFLKRHKLSLRTPSKTSVARAMAFNKVQVDLYFTNLKALFQRHQFSSSRIFNMDESGLSTVPNKTPKIVSIKGQKVVGKISSAERGQTITIVCCMSAAGWYVPPAIIFPRKRRKAELIDGAPPGSILFTSDSGYINTDLFLEWLTHFQTHVKSSETDPTLLILDNHSSHTSLQAILFAREHHIHILSLPPHSSHKTQPLDRCFFKPLKDFYSQACENWLLNNPGRTITQYQVASLFSESYQRAATLGKAVNSFKVCGIFPINPSVFTEEDFLPSTVTDQHEMLNDHTRLNADEEFENINPTEPTDLTVTHSPDADAVSIISDSEICQDIAVPSSSKEVVPKSDSHTYSTSSDIAGPSSVKKNLAPRQDVAVPSTSQEVIAEGRVLSTNTTPSAIAGPSTLEKVSPARVLLTQILPLPKRTDASLRKGKGKKSTILTSTPIKDELEEQLQKKKRRKEKSRQKKCF